jgi:SPW repeat
MEASMSINRFFNTHRTWEEWCGMILGIVILLSPWFTTRPEHGEVIINAMGVGILVFGLAQLEYLVLQRWEEAGSFVLGVWLICSPFIFDYAGAEPLRYWHFVLGALVAALAALELWQDWMLSDQELAEHGK